MELSHNQKKLLRQLDEAYLDELEDELKFALVQEPGGRTYYQLDGTHWLQSDSHILPFETVRVSGDDVKELEQEGYINLRLEKDQYRISITEIGRACVPPKGKPWKEPT
jgi:hypothetical protein